jgi:N-acetylmuramoyl-L-alanine amidase
METQDQAIFKENRPARVNLFRQLWIIFSWGVVLATFFTAWTPYGLVPLGLKDRINEILSPPDNPLAFLPTVTPRPRPMIAIVAGHYQNDSGAICADGLTEAEINLDIATRVEKLLTQEGFDVYLMAEKDERLYGFQGLALVSIHADSCEFINNEATGFKVAAALASARPDKANRLVACLTSRYYETTGMTFHAGSITQDMTSYHAFEEIHNETAAAIIETGFMNLDRLILTKRPDLIAEGITKGILCYIRNEDASLPAAPSP